MTRLGENIATGRCCGGEPTLSSLQMIVAYDISDDRRRARVAALLSAWGDRIERSVFECRIGIDDLPDLIARLEDLIDLDDDAVHMFRQCARCDEDRVQLGQAIGMQSEPYWVL